MSQRHEPREDDHLVEPMYGALRADAARSAPNPRWRILWFVLGAAAIAWIVWRQAF